MAALGSKCTMQTYEIFLSSNSSNNFCPSSRNLFITFVRSFRMLHRFERMYSSVDDV